MSRTVLVTGASRGLGVEFVKQCAARGDTVIAALRSPEKAKDIAKLASRVIALDIADEKSITAAAAQLKGTPIDILINNAGMMGEDKGADKVSFAEFRKVFDVNVFGLAVLTRALLPNLRAGRGKQILNITSELGSISQATGGFSYAYCSSKSAVNMITRLTAKELSGEGIMAVAFCPGWNKTDMGGPEAPLNPADSVGKLLKTAEGLTMAESGSYRRIDGSVIPF